MKRLMTSESFIFENKSNRFIDEILKELEPTIDMMVEKTRIYVIEKMGSHAWNESTEEMTRWNLVLDLVKSIEIYTKPTDKLVRISASGSAKGSITIRATIEREGVEYPLYTDVIIAEGPIQKAHYRYLTKTKLPKTGNTEVADQYKEKIKRLTKEQKFNKDIQDYENRIKREEERIEEFSQYTTDEDIIERLKELQEMNPKQYWWYELPTWEEIVRNDASKNYENSEEFFNSEMNKNVQRKIDNFKDVIRTSKIHIKDYKKEIEKLKIKLSKI